MVEVVDTTLREGEQMLDVSHTAGERTSIARPLIGWGCKVDRIEFSIAQVYAGERESPHKYLTTQLGKSPGGYLCSIEQTVCQANWIGLTKISAWRTSPTA